MGIFTALALFLKPICEAQLSFAAHQKYILCFFLIVMYIWLIWNLAFVFPLIYISVEQEAMAG